MPVDVSRETSNVLLPMDVSQEIWAKTIEESSVMTLATHRNLPGAGEEFQTIEGEPEAAWVNETDEKPVSKPAFGTSSWKGYTMAVIIPFSNQFRRDKARLYSEIVARAPKSLGTKLDKTVFGTDEKPGELFDTMAGVETMSLGDDIWGTLVGADAAIADGDGILDGWALAPAAKSKLLTALDNVGRPLFINDFTSTNNVPTLMGQKAVIRKGVYDASQDPEQLGFAGDWTSAYYGVVEGIKTSMSDQATLNYDGETINLWQRNMFALRFEFEVGFKLKYPEHFVKLTA